MFDLEQGIMNVWGMKEDLQLLSEAILDTNISTDDIANTLIGMEKILQLRCEKLFSIYEYILKNNKSL